jgi:hypothetical protein
MSIKVMNLVWANANVSGSELLILLAMADFSNDEGGDIFPSMQTLARKARLSEPQARRVVQNLAKQGYIEVIEKGGWDGKRNRSNSYRILVENVGGINLIPPPSRGRDHSGSADDTTVVSPVRDDPPYNRTRKPPLKKVRPTQGRKSYNPDDYPDL